MNIPDLTNETLQALHDLIRDALKADDDAGVGKTLYGVREYPDWKKQTDAFEREMTSRGMSFKNIVWAKAASQDTPGART